MKELPAIGTAIEVIKHDSFLSTRTPWLTGKRGIVTAHKGDRDVIIDGHHWSVDIDRIKELEGGDLYRMTGVINIDVAGTLHEVQQGGRLLHVKNCHGEHFLYLDTKQSGPHYVDEEWIRDLLAAGVIESLDKPQVFNGVLEAPRGMVLAYHIKFADAQKGIVYPYVIRTVHSVWLYDKAAGRWVNMPWDRIPTECPWVLDVQRAWSKVEAELVEAFEYPRLPAVVEQFQQEILHNA